ncbi:hypothetical protein NDU88_010508 [Pleurodeles waltl]|uniref:Uncharacterized protein n=1 Tax=Pleurodeles waltl TaxID=8319 RepID=A0AAV7RZU7_PLEWA|nr:hypothetical protein NDU88_010508 [Pleurodeles waltl]
MKLSERSGQTGQDCRFSARTLMGIYRAILTHSLCPAGGLEPVQLPRQELSSAASRLYIKSLGSPACVSAPRRAPSVAGHPVLCKIGAGPRDAAGQARPQSSRAPQRQHLSGTEGGENQGKSRSKKDPMFARPSEPRRSALCWSRTITDPSWVRCPWGKHAESKGTGCDKAPLSSSRHRLPCS